MVQLTGITWNHSRGYTPLVACSQRFSELNPDVEITWDKRSLQAFADRPIDELARQFDLLIIDHPWAGFAARTKVILPLNEYLSKVFLEDQERNSLGKSHESYQFNNQQWAIAIDAATPVAASRPDLFIKNGYQLPVSYNQLIDLSKSGKVAIPGIPQDILMSFYMICSTLNEDVCLSESQVISNKVGIKSLQLLRELGKNINKECYFWNPIEVYEALSQTDDYIYCPFAYGYANYSRPGYARRCIKFHDMVVLEGQKLVTTLGGTGIAISSHSKQKKIASKFVEYIGSESIQKTLFFNCGGQPGHRKAWIDKYINRETSNFFKDTIHALDRAFLRPRYHGHMYFQDRAGAPIREYMMNGGNEKNLLMHLNEVYTQSKLL